MDGHGEMVVVIDFLMGLMRSRGMNCLGKSGGGGAAEGAQWVTASAAKPDNLGSIPQTHTGGRKEWTPEHCPRPSTRTLQHMHAHACTGKETNGCDYEY